MHMYECVRYGYVSSINFTFTNYSYTIHWGNAFKIYLANSAAILLILLDIIRNLNVYMFCILECNAMPKWWQTFKTI